MTIGVYEKPSLLAELLVKETSAQANSRTPGIQDRIFADRLDTLLATDGQTPKTAQATAQSLAESLKLQMLHSSLALSGDHSDDAGITSAINRQQSTIQSLIKAYGANQAQPATASALSIPSQSLPDLSVTVSPSGTQSDTLPSGSQWLDPIITKASSRYGVDACLIKAVIKAESNFNPHAVSRAGARGLMQLMPGTARTLGVSDSFDPEQNIMAGTRFLRDLLNRYNGDLDSTLAAYNWGPGNIDKRPDRLPQETRNYLSRVKQLYSSYTA